MLDFDKFLGFLFFLTMALAGFWCLTFIALMIPGWIGGWLGNFGKEKKGEDTNEDSRLELSKQEGVEVVYIANTNDQ